MTPASTLKARALFGSFLIAFCLVASVTSPALARVNLGNNVHIGGHDFSNQTYDRKHRAVIYLYDKTPYNEGCGWHADGHGGRVKTCHLKRIR